MMRQFSEIVRWECYSLCRGRIPAILLFLTPLIFTLLFGMVYEQNTVRHIPAVIYDADQSSISRSLIKVYNDSDRIDICHYVYSSEAMEAALTKDEAQLALAIPKYFAKDINAGRQTQIALIVNSTNNLFANSALSATEEMNRTFCIAIAQKLMESYGANSVAAMEMVYPIKLGVRIINNPTTGYTLFMLPGLMLNGLQIALLITVAPLLAAFIRRQIYDESKYSSASILLAKALPYWLLGVIMYIISLIVMEHFWAVPIRGSWIDILLLGAAYNFAVIGILYLVSSLAADETQAVQLPLLYIMPGLLYSGLSFPIISMEGFGRWYANTMPLTYAADSLRDLLLAGYAPDLFGDVSTLLGMGIGCGTVAGILFTLRRRR
ncbi:ABC-2 type transport system permease protein [Propionispira arboris]|uniref:ABC-2 type transport system permease protein n=1 Tax=Propionispira arboris TaxID=84035 RepID=A0A1H7A209_9FIRM|nr:ABC transporter permease [Propionispira arboris]SEJ59518.1 ABC-2 type transport system permease protein [Propionispira arboris]